MKKARKFKLFLLLLFLFSTTSGQSLNEAIEDMSSEIVTSYAGPALNPLAANINSAWLSRIPAPEMAGFSFSIGINGMISPIKDAPETFTSTGTFYLTPEQATTIVQDQVDNTNIQSQIIEQLVNTKFMLELTGTTITGSERSGLTISIFPEKDLIFAVDDPEIPFPINIEIQESEIREVDLDAYLNAISSLPYGAVQLNLGTLAGTEVMVRFIPSTEIDEEFGSIGMYGVGLLHNPQVWFDDKLPIELSLGFLTQSFDLSSRGSINSFSAGLNLRKSFEFSWITIAPFVNAMTEKTEFELVETRTFTTNYGSETVDLKLIAEGENKFRVGVGTVFSISFLDFTFAYNFSKYNTLVGGISFNFDFFNN